MKERGQTKVLHVIDSLGMGGAETWLMELLRLWSRTGEAQMDLLMTSGKQGLFDDEARVLGAKTYYVQYGRSSALHFAKHFRQLLREGRYWAIHDHQDYASGWHWCLGNNALPPVRVTHVHNPAYQIRNNYGVTLGRRLTARLGKAFVARYSTHIAGTSQQVITDYGFNAKCFRKIPKAVLHCGFRTSRFVGDTRSARQSICQEFGWPENARIILFAGRVDQSAEVGHPQNHKNSAFGLSVGIQCLLRDPEVRMLFAGAPSAAVPELQARIASAGLTGAIRFAGIRGDIERLMLASAVLLFPSRSEGLGMVAVEAQAAGLPVLASTEVPRECVVVPGLVHFQSLQDEESRWADSLFQLAGRPRDVPRANQQLAGSSFAIEKSADALLRLYRSGSFA